MYNEASMRIFSSLKNCLHDVVEFTPVIALITLFWSLKIFFNTFRTKSSEKVKSEYLGNIGCLDTKMFHLLLGFSYWLHHYGEFL